MDQTLHFSSFLRFSPTRTNPFPLSPEFSMLCQNLLRPSFNALSLHRKVVGFHSPGKIIVFGGKIEVVNAGSGDGVLQELDDSPVSVELVPILSESQFDRIIAEAQELEESVIIVWMAGWCRKCIYLKPKLEKLAADCYPRLRFYCVDVNNVPHKLVAYAGVTKMPTIQLWKDSKKQSEVIGGQKAHFVINEAREMIENESTI